MLCVGSGTNHLPEVHAWSWTRYEHISTTQKTHFPNPSASRWIVMDTHNTHSYLWLSAVELQQWFRWLSNSCAAAYPSRSSRTYIQSFHNKPTEIPQASPELMFKRVRFVGSDIHAHVYTTNSMCISNIKNLMPKHSCHQNQPKFIQVHPSCPASGCIFFWGKEAQHSWNVPSKACAITSLDAGNSPCLQSEKKESRLTLNTLNMYVLFNPCAVLATQMKIHANKNQIDSRGISRHR